MISVGVDWSSSDSSAIRYVLPVLWASFSHNGANSPEAKATRVCFAEFARRRHGGGEVCRHRLHFSAIYILTASEEKYLYNKRLH